MHRVRRDQFIYGFSAGAPPVLTIDPGDQVVFETHDSSTGRIRTADDLPAYLKVREATKVNPAAGPVFVRGAKPGDELVVVIENIELAGQGYVRAAPGSPVVDEGIEGPVAYIVRIEDGEMRLPGGLRLPARPMVGTIGTAPVDGVVYTAHPGPQGSNLDCNVIKPGSKVHLPVNVEGALFALGDVHASMGDGEVTGTGVEIEADVKTTILLASGDSRNRPWIEADGQIHTVGFGPTLQQAVNMACAGMIDMLSERFAISRTDAFMLLSMQGDCHVGQCCGGLDATAYLSFADTHNPPG